MYSLTHSATIVGIDGKKIAVEVDIANGLPQLTIVGLPDPAIREAVERVRAAIKNSGFQFPLGRITVNLAPANLRKEGTSFDLAIAIGILTASGQLRNDLFADALVIGELSLDGTVQPLAGVLAMIEEARKEQFRYIILPKDNIQEAICLSGLHYIGLKQLKQLTNVNDLLHSTTHTALAIVNSESETNKWMNQMTQQLDYSDVIGQQVALRAMLIAASGKHNVLLSGAPGTGKTMMVRRLPSILPPLDEDEALAVTKIYSISGKLPSHLNGLLAMPPFRAPHHTISSAGLIGGGIIPKPGEITLAHHGILFLDELLEFPRQLLEMLRQPLEDRFVNISRTRAAVTFPASFMLLASYNPCPCGFFNQSLYHDQRCTCSSIQISRYLSKLSGPLRDRFDMQLHIAKPIHLQMNNMIPTPDVQLLAQNNFQSSPLHSSAAMRLVVMQARQYSLQRNKQFAIKYNSELNGAALRRAASLEPNAKTLLLHVFDHFQLSMRSYDRIIKVARTIADMEQNESITEQHIAEALQYRQMEL
ncbi:YifB family Mg chelatase-like AAA ATPase [Paenibacillus yanchengensis]|uniref:YifB family Mg chelatase-like AAA ATPase n=1 Tax=Paenibacillus yanchengensis TaxID=2035833 RepID=A0ABW4YM79_9BACL